MPGAEGAGAGKKPAKTTKYDTVIVGAGFAGMYMLHKLRGMGLKAHVFEAGSGVGGTWFWNRYPGARVDIESQEYSFSFSKELEEEWQWSERYAPQGELLDYANHVADRFDLRRDISFNTRINAASYDDHTGLWRITTDQGETIEARYCVMATGCLSAAKTPDIPGAGTFKGLTLSTATWPEDVDLSGKRVGIIGTGSSGIQTITTIAPQVGELFVFQRTPNYSVPAHNGPLDPAVREDWLANREDYRQQQRESGIGIVTLEPTEELALEQSEEDRLREFERRWAKGGFCVGAPYADTGVDPAANKLLADFVAGKVREIVKDPETADLLIPKTYPFGTKRLVVDTGYFEVYNQDNVHLIDLNKSPIETITETGLRTSERDYEFDVLIYAIGFDAMTGSLERIDIRGRDGLKLKDKWAAGPLTYLGLTVSGFPNMFMITGPGSPSVLSNMIVSIEQHVDWIADCIQDMAERQLNVVEATPEAEAEWVAHVNEVATETLYLQANSWYLGANVPGKPRVFMPYVGGVGVYREVCDDVAANDYKGFTLSRAPAEAS
ncbi:flavin-containing monooxygenase [Hyphomonas jannaschiana]|uniref:FAD dependent oxidoreductase n=1 Tax=Hyphomonas jannaschiana VP2 TaxID=1280952 RepID=A0A059FF36_9PROT|nr:NAD(P)/FAD-dependent oxidoreductase [Hyphomonas jannaschiana]KCZ89244.1 FAD dependent oxidoreductase [Hyphomonas jannaschiana VP2]